MILITWEIWKEWNARVFNNKYTNPVALFQIRDESKEWVLAGGRHLVEAIS